MIVSGTASIWRGSWHRGGREAGFVARSRIYLWELRVISGGFAAFSPLNGGRTEGAEVRETLWWRRSRRTPCSSRPKT